MNKKARQWKYAQASSVIGAELAAVKQEKQGERHEEEGV